MKLIPVKYLVFFMVFLCIVPTGRKLFAVEVDLKMDGSDAPMAMAAHTPISLSITVDNQGNDSMGDWWLVYYVNGAWHYFDPAASSWESGISVTYQGSLFSFTAEMPLLPQGLAQGEYIFFFAVDTAMDGEVGAEIYYDAVNASIGDTTHEEGLSVELYNPEKVMMGNTLFAYSHGQGNPRVVEVDIQGEVVWAFDLPGHLKSYTNPGFDAELLSSGNILIVLPRYGLLEINRAGETVWSHMDSKISHDADRLANGNTLYVFGDFDTPDDCQVKEVDQGGNLVWCWAAGDYFNLEPYIGIEREGWTHANAADRLENGNTLISLRNFDLTIEVDPQGDVVWQYDWTTLGGERTDPHEPELGKDDNLLVCLQQQSPYRAVEIERSTGRLVWSYEQAGLETTRDCDRLENGNILVVGVMRNVDESVMMELAPDGEILWQMTLKGFSVEGKPGWFYKAQRLSLNR